MEKKNKSKKVKNIVEEDVLTCACHNPNHVIRVKYNRRLNAAFFEIHLNKLSFWERLKNAFIYLFGKETKYGEYDDFIFDIENVDKLIEIGNKIKNNYI